MDRPLTPRDASALLAAAKAPTMSEALDRARALLRESAPQPKQIEPPNRKVN